MADYGVRYTGFKHQSFDACRGEKVQSAVVLQFPAMSRHRFGAHLLPPMAHVSRLCDRLSLAPSMPRKSRVEDDHSAIQIEVMIPVRQNGRAKAMEKARGPAAPVPPPSPRIPRVTRLMALAIKFEEIVDRGEVRDYADLARLGHVTRARMSQIMNLSFRRRIFNRPCCTPPRRSRLRSATCDRPSAK